MRLLSRFIFIAVVMLFVAGCGGGGLSSAVGNSGPSVSVSLDTPSLSATMSDTGKSVSLTLSCSSTDLFTVECIVNKVLIGLADMSYEVPVNAVLKSGEVRTVEIPVFTNSHKEIAPFNYLRDINPSTSASNWNVMSEILGTPTSFLIGKGASQMVSDPNNPGKQISVQNNNFNSSVPSFTPGTMRVTDGTQVLDETTFGYLSGQGSGIVSGSSVNVSFTAAPATGVLIVGMYLPQLKDLAAPPQTTALKIVYDDLTLTQSGSFLQDASGNVYATVSGTKITPVRAMGFKNAPLVAVYDAPPFTSYGGAILGYADGVSKIFTMKTRYAPLVAHSARVMTERAPATIIMENPYTGDLTFSFAEPPVSGEPIKVSYIVESVNTAINLDVVTSSGSTRFSVPFTVTK